MNKTNEKLDPAARVEENSDPREAIVKVTTSVPVEVLTRHGIKRIRILNEAKFLNVMRDFLKSSVQKRLDALKADLSASSVNQRQRARNLGSLRQIEGRMLKLSHALEEIQTAFERMEKRGKRKKETSSRHSGEKKQRTLLREMLLGD